MQKNRNIWKIGYQFNVIDYVVYSHRGATTSRLIVSFIDVLYTHEIYFVVAAARRA